MTEELEKQILKEISKKGLGEIKAKEFAAGAKFMLTIIHERYRLATIDDAKVIAELKQQIWRMGKHIELLEEKHGSK